LKLNSIALLLKLTFNPDFEVEFAVKGKKVINSGV
jgi:hypothetical protein